MVDTLKPLQTDDDSDESRFSPEVWLEVVSFLDRHAGEVVEVSSLIEELGHFIVPEEEIGDPEELFDTIIEVTTVVLDALIPEMVAKDMIVPIEPEDKEMIITSYSIPPKVEPNVKS